jgi:SOS-response transcriptional repressor LexA
VPFARLAKKYPKWYEWAYKPLGIEQVGCIYTAQGFEFDYAGVIIGEDLKYDPKTGKIITDRTACKDPVLRRNVSEANMTFDDYVRNIYRVLMSRGKRGCFIYCCDTALSEYFKSLLVKANCRMCEEESIDNHVVIERLVKSELMFVDYLPFYEMRAACGYFGNGELVEPAGWVRVDSLGRLNRNMFVVRASGQSMEPKIHDGDLCVFNARPVGTRQGKIVLVELHDATDPESGGAYTIKKYQSEKMDLGYGEWTHSRICLHPLNLKYQTIVIEENLDEVFTVVAEFVKVLSHDKEVQYEG